MGQQYQYNPEVALSEVTALIHDAIQDKRLRRVSLEQIQIIAVSYQVNLTKEFPTALVGFYRDYLRQCLQDRVISEAEAEDLAHLKLVLGLNDQTVDAIHHEVIHAVYEASVEDVLADGRLDADEQRFLERLQYDLKLSDDIAHAIYAREAKDYITRYYQYIVGDERLSPEEEQELNAIARSLGVDIDVDEHTQSALNKYRLYWVIENGRLPHLEASVALQPDEQCYLEVDSAWYEPRLKTLAERISHVRFYKSAYQRVTHLDELSLAEDDWRQIDTGRVSLTNQRLILSGKAAHDEIALDKILDVQVYRNGLEVISTSGTSPFLAIDKGLDIFLVLLGRAIRDLD
ncbi:MAG: hypothetical protein H6673_04820 [Anaerolineales bacterium]|nr:hypothetical protein [Anaerolineales bacterium]